MDVMGETVPIRNVHLVRQNQVKSGIAAVSSFKLKLEGPESLNLEEQRPFPEEYGSHQVVGGLENH